MTDETPEAVRAERDALREENDALRAALAELGRVLEGLAEGTTKALEEAQRLYDQLPA
jgi:hypothetical protein